MLGNHFIQFKHTGSSGNLSGSNYMIHHIATENLSTDGRQMLLTLAGCRIFHCNCIVAGLCIASTISSIVTRQRKNGKLWEEIVLE